MKLRCLWPVRSHDLFALCFCFSALDQPANGESTKKKCPSEHDQSSRQIWHVRLYLILLNRSEFLDRADLDGGEDLAGQAVQDKG